MNPQPTYWAFRIDKRFIIKLDQELQGGRLRQGWGWDPSQNLRNLKLDKGAARNLRMLEVKKGDRILISHLPQYGHITIAEATKDWRDGYEFEIFETGDHGHVFPAKPIVNFSRSNANIAASIRRTFRNPGRFWNISYLGDSIENVIKINPSELSASSTAVDRWKQSVIESANDNQFAKIFEKCTTGIGDTEWEFLLVDVLKRLNPAWKVMRTGGTTEKDHGADILMTMPDPFGKGRYGIAIQVKDWSGSIGSSPISQIEKSRTYWKSQEIEIIKLMVFAIRGVQEINADLEHRANENDIQIIWAKDIQELVLRAACHFASTAGVD